LPSSSPPSPQSSSYLLLIRKSWAIFVYATILSIESIFIEYLTESYFKFSPLILSATSITLSGLMLLLVGIFVIGKKKQVTNIFTKSPLTLIFASLFLSVGVFMWYDSINRIGASKEALIAGPLEIVIVVVLARTFLKEKLSKIQVLGIMMAIVGFFMAISSDISFTNDSSNNNNDNIASNMSTVTVVAVHSSEWSNIFSIGNIEAIVSAFGFAIGVIFLSKLLKSHSPLEVAGSSMFIAGLILWALIPLALFGLGYSTDTWVMFDSGSAITTIIILILFSFLPFVGSLSYSTGLSKIGASLAATIGSSSILITVMLQMTLKEIGLETHLPGNIYLAVLGGITGFIGICIIHSRDYSPHHTYPQKSKKNNLEEGEGN
jgi:drug/metabolite transporter (DMT)-like permease